MKHPLSSLFFQWSLELRFYRAREISSVHLCNKVVYRVYTCWHLTRALSILGVPRQFTCSLAVWDGRWRGGESRRCSILLLHLWRRGGRLPQPGSTQQEDPQPEHLFSQQLLRVQVGVKHWPHTWSDDKPVIAFGAKGHTSCMITTRCHSFLDHALNQPVF